MCWTQKKLLVDFCQGNVAAEQFHTWLPLILTWQHNGENEILHCGLSERSEHHRAAGAPCPTSSCSAKEIPGGDRLAQLNMGKAGCQISALGQSRGDCCYWINLWELSFSDCWQFPFWSVLGLPVSWDEALGVPGCQKQSSPALPCAPAKQCPPAQGTASQGLILLACGHCWSTLPKPELLTWLFFFNFPFDMLLFYSAAVKV